ncbi:PD-(D/E)XK nuclease family protein [Robertmurraya yapensis]|uniref:PD-(D/E)XK nuclease family protein n=1 Tax=Bacillus yapensis TaxID=2492960 RepID=A0A3S0KKL0_9BACI|nr:PD-(D/E)XK nuclease family protein [Bacillus yapensis]RTR28783.1 PD-(D/E)XK nuclease family protein [Bacillus yapensis]TKS94641.1 hypothetical protein FAR12_16325 [Bacillus yapensis]
MKSLVKELKLLCDNFPLTEKIIIVDSFLIGEQINVAYNLQGYHSINLKFKTAFDLAREITEIYAPSMGKILDPTIAEQMMYSLLDDLKAENKLDYFSGMEITPTFSKAIYSTIRQLRGAGYSKENFPFDAFLSKSKAEDLHTILEQFESLLERNKLIDEAAVYLTASEFVNKRDDVIYILQSNLQLNYMAEEFLKQLLPELTYKLPLAQVRGVQTVEKSGIRSISWGDTSTLSYIYDVENAKDKPELAYFTAKTEELEIKEVLERIKSSNLPFDQNVVYYTNSESYVTLFYHLAQQIDIPLTFGEGLPISFSRPGRLVSGLLKWLQTNYSVQPFLDLLQEGLIDIGDEAPSKGKIAGYLRELQIGWSKQRYLGKLDEEMRALEKALETAEQEEKKAHLTKQLNDLNWLSKWFQAIFKRLPEYDSQINYRSFLEGIVYLLRNSCATKSGMDEVGKTTILDTIEKVLPYANEVLSSYEIVEKVRDLLLSLRIKQSKAKPGHLHVASYRSGVYNHRPNVYIVGLDNRHFPGTTSEDPLLLDRERKALGRNIPVLQNTGQENLYLMNQLLAHTSGPVTVSYCHFDIHNNRAVSPAHLFLQLYRYGTGKHEADFKELKSLPSYLTAREVIENKDYWNQLLSDESNKVLDSELLSHYPNLEYGLKSEKHRQAPDFTEYDGLVQVEQEALDPRINKEERVSAAKLEALAKCPYSYFLQHVLRVRPIEHTEYDPYRWLDAATRGSLLHSIFENFYKEIKEEKPSVKAHEHTIQTIAGQLIDRQKELIPPPNERIFAKEVDDILACCSIFLKEEETHSASYKPLHFEYAFGVRDHDPAVVTLPSGDTILVAGMIDRMDEADSGDYHIIDYKTGSTYSYSNKDIFKGGRQLQHMLYALAIEQHLQLESGKVQESAYYFPTVKGMATRVTRKQDDTVRRNGLDILERLIDVLKTGTFTMTDDENDCKFCDFKAVCRRKFYDKDVLNVKQMDQNFEELRRFKGVRAYD